MTLEEIQTVVQRSAKLRSPTFLPDNRSSDKIDRLEDHMLACASMRGELEDSWRYCTRAIGALEERMQATWQSPPRRTAAERDQVRRRADPETWGALRDARQLKAEIERQIHRLGKDEATVSRAYTFITGQA